MIFVVVIHCIICVLLLTVVLMQSGRGGGLTDTFAAAESMFGAKTNEFMVKTTTVLAAMFLITSLALAYFSARKDQSLMDRIKHLPKIDITTPAAKKEEAPAATDKSAVADKPVVAETSAASTETAVPAAAVPAAPVTTPEVTAPAAEKK